jgi:hypothetical protein
VKVHKILMIFLVLAAQFYFGAVSQAEPTALAADRYEERMFRSVSLPEKDRLSFVSFVQIFEQDKLLGGLAAYDDAMTERPADYLELYNSAGHVVAIAWFDNFGIERVAVDRAVLEDRDALEGVFVEVVDGDFV